jgi:two-component system osmolarity sensor histidine kinase EnvZ
MRYADTININASKGRKWLIITIDDDGPGIPKDKREEVFNAFLRLDDSRNQNQGNTGLGLSIARDIIRGHGGDIRLEESSLGGLRAKVRVPI